MGSAPDPFPPLDPPEEHLDLPNTAKFCHNTVGSTTGHAVHEAGRLNIADGVRSQAAQEGDPT